MKKGQNMKYVIAWVISFLLLGCSPTPSTGDLNPNKKSRKISEIFLSQKNKTIVNFGNREVEISKDKSGFSYIDGVHLKEKEYLYDNNKSRKAVKKLVEDSLIEDKNDKYNLKHTRLRKIFSLYDLNETLVPDMFVTNLQHTLVKVKSDTVTFEDDKISYNNGQRFPKECFNLTQINVKGKMLPLFTQFKDTEGYMCQQNYSENYIAWWDEKQEKLLITELNQFFSAYTNIDLYEYIKSGYGGLLQSIMINPDGLHSVKVDGDNLSYKYIPFDNFKDVAQFSKKFE
jgi:hypothetical protein